MRVTRCAHSRCSAGAHEELKNHVKAKLLKGMRLRVTDDYEIQWEMRQRIFEYSLQMSREIFSIFDGTCTIINARSCSFACEKVSALSFTLISTLPEQTESWDRQSAVRCAVLIFPVTADSAVRCGAVCSARQPDLFHVCSSKPAQLYILLKQMNDDTNLISTEIIGCRQCFKVIFDSFTSVQWLGLPAAGPELPAM